MFKKKLTLMLIPNSSVGILRQLRIPVAVVYLAAAAVVALVFTNFFLSAEFFTTKVDQIELERLRGENDALKKKFEKMRWNLAEVERRYDELVEQEVRIRNLFDLPEVSDDERMVGIGGPGPLQPGMTSPAARAAALGESDLDYLLRLSRLELEKYEEVEKSVAEVKDRLDHTPSIWPCEGWLSAGFGMREDPFTGYRQMHRGLDIANHHGTPVVATADGVVRQALTTSYRMGKYVVIDHGYGFQTRYGHLSAINVKAGQKVKRGDVIAMMGSTGYSTGPHLHYEVMRNGQYLNPHTFILNDLEL